MPPKPRQPWRALLLAAALPATALGQTPSGGSPVLATPGISQTLARHRAATIAGVRYDLSLDLTALDSAVGQVTIRFRRSGPADAILDFRGRRLTHAAANGTPLPSPTVTHGHLVIPARLLQPGQVRPSALARCATISAMCNPGSGSGSRHSSSAMWAVLSGHTKKSQHASASRCAVRAR